MALSQTHTATKECMYMPYETGYKLAYMATEAHKKEAEKRNFDPKKWKSLQGAGTWTRS